MHHGVVVAAVSEQSAYYCGPPPYDAYVRVCVFAQGCHLAFILYDLAAAVSFQSQA